MFKDFNIDKFKKMKPPSDSSFDTMREVKDINKIPLDKEKIKKFDNIEKTFKSIADNNDIIDYPSKLIKDLINKSAPIILKLKNYFHIKVNMNLLLKMLKRYLYLINLSM